jgi:hypothetical protein
MVAVSTAGAASAWGNVPAAEAGNWVVSAGPALAAWSGAAWAAAGGGAAGATVGGGPAGSADPTGATDASEAGSCGDSGTAWSRGDGPDTAGVAGTVGADWVAVPSGPRSTTDGCGPARPDKTARPTDAGEPVGELAEVGFTITGTVGEAQSLGILAPKAGIAEDRAPSATAVPGAPGRLATVGTGSASGAIGRCCDVACMNCSE